MNTRYFQAVYSNLLKEWSVRAVPSLERVATMPTEESAQAYALALNEWLASKPDPARVHPFFSSASLDALMLEGRTSEERLTRILDAMAQPELYAAALVNEHEGRAA